MSEIAAEGDAQALICVYCGGYLYHSFQQCPAHDETERSKREVEAEPVTYVVGRHFGLDTSDSAFYLAAWQDEGTDGLQERLARISRTASEIIGAIPIDENDRA